MNIKNLIKKTEEINGFDGKDPLIVLSDMDHMTEHSTEISVTKSGVPCIFEQGGKYVKSGWARIVASASGNPKKPIMVKTHGNLACAEHALIAINNDTLIFEGLTIGEVGDRMKTVVKVYKVADIDVENKTCKLVPIEYKGKWYPVIAAAVKANHYHCRTPYYIRKDEDGATFKVDDIDKEINNLEDTLTKGEVSKNIDTDYSDIDEISIEDTDEAFE